MEVKNMTYEINFYKWVGSLADKNHRDETQDRKDEGLSVQGLGTSTGAAETTAESEGGNHQRHHTETFWS